MSSGSSLQVMIYGNFDVMPQTGTISFPSTGTWYNFFTGASTSVTTTALQNVTLQPGEYYVFLNIGGALPVTLISFTGKNSGKTNVLSWEVANEENLNYYELQRSTDGQNFFDISKINATGKSEYNYSDN